MVTLVNGPTNHVANATLLTAQTQTEINEHVQNLTNTSSISNRRMKIFFHANHNMLKNFRRTIACTE